MLTVRYERLRLQPNEKVLDLGCGFGRHAYEALRRGANVVACDLGYEELVQVRSVAAVMWEDGEIDEGIMLETTNGNATQLPFADESFDRIIASEVMEHIEQDQEVLGELARVLRPGGTLAITIPSKFPERVCWALSEDYHAPNAVGGHVRIYGRTELEEKISSAGLFPLGSHKAHALHSPYWWLRCAIGPNKSIEENRLVKAYHRLLTWDIVKAPKLTRWTESLLNPLLGKSKIVYAAKPDLENSHATT